MRRFIDTAGYYVTDEPSFMEKEHAMTEELSEKLQKFHMDVVKGKSGTADRLIKLIGKNPRNPQVKNLLTSYYLVIGEPEKAYAFNRKTIEAHPDYFFGKLNLAQEHIYNNEHEKIVEVLGLDFDLAQLYPERDTFHVSEAMGILKFAVIYYSHLKEFEKAEAFIEQMKAIDEDDFEVENAEEILFAEVLDQVANRSKAEAEKSIDVEVPEQKVTTKMQKPKFNHPEIEILYHYDVNIPVDKLEQLLLLPRVTLMEDLVSVINDGIERYTYFYDDQEVSEEETFFVFHAINLLAELKAVEQLPVVLHLLKQSEELIDFYLGMYLTENIWLSIYILGNEQLHVLEDFMKSPGIHTFSKTAVSEAIMQISFEGIERKNEVIECYSSILKFYLKADLKDNVIDSNLIGHIISDIIDIQGEELLPKITELYNLGYVSEEVCGDLEAVEHNLNVSYESTQKNEVLNLKSLYQDITGSWLNANPNFNNYKKLEVKSDNTPYNDDKPYISEKKIGRNDPCICGSGKKYKKCCL